MAEARSSSRSNKNNASVEEGVDVAARVERDSKLRQELEIYTTPYLAAWYDKQRLAPPKGVTVPDLAWKQRGDKEWILSTLVNKGLGWGKGGRTEATRSKAIKAALTEQLRAGAPVPVLLQSAMDASGEEEDEEEEDEQEGASATSSEPGTTAKPPAKPKKASRPAAAASVATDDAGHAAPMRLCACCAEETTVAEGMFKCRSCGLRGDLELDDKINVFLAAKLTGIKLSAASAEATTKAQERGSGQSPARAPPPARLSPIDAELVRIAAASPLSLSSPPRRRHALWKRPSR